MTAQSFSIKLPMSSNMALKALFVTLRSVSPMDERTPSRHLDLHDGVADDAI
jgi:hypothetical protein